jgi:hypothetical protein
VQEGGFPEQLCCPLSKSKMQNRTSMVGTYVVVQDEQVEQQVEQQKGLFVVKMILIMRNHHALVYGGGKCALTLHRMH